MRLPFVLHTRALLPEGTRRRHSGPTRLLLAMGLAVAACGAGVGIPAFNFAGDRRPALAADGPPHSPIPAVATAPAATTRAYNTFAVLATPVVRESGFADLVSAQLGELPGVRLVERDQLRAITGELSAASLLGPDASAGRLKLGRLVRADALVVLAEEDGDAAALAREPNASAPAPSRPDQAAPPAGRAAAARPAPFTLRQVQLVIADCRQGARLRVMHLPVGDRDASAAITAATAAVRDARDHYPQGVRWIVGTSPFVSRNLTHDFDLDQRRFGALLDAALSSQPGVAVLESQEARAIAREHAFDPRPDGPAGDVAGRNVPLVVEGEFEVEGAPAAPKGEAIPATREAIRRSTVSFAVTLADGTGDPAQTVRRTVPFAEVATFLGQDLPAAIFRLAPPADRKPLPPDAQFKALVDRAGEFARLDAVEHSTPLREAALLLRFEGADAVAQRRRLVDEYTRLTQRPLFGTLAPEERAARRQAMHDRAWEAGLDHFEYLVRNRQLNRTDATRLLLGLRWYTGAMAPDGPPRLKQYLEEMLPPVWALPPATPEPRSHASPAEAEADDRDRWLGALIATMNCDRLCWSGGHVMTQEGYDAIMAVIDRWMPADAYPHHSVVGLFGYLPATSAVEHWSLSTGPGPIPADAPLTGRQIDRQYAAFLSRLEHCGKPGYEALAPYARLFDKHVRLCVHNRAVATPEELTTLLGEVKAFQAYYLSLRLGGKPPAGQDPVVRNLRDTVEDVERVIDWKRSKGQPRGTGWPTGATRAPETSPATRPATDAPIAGAPPVIDRGNRLWLVPLSVRVKGESGGLAEYGKLRARDPAWAFGEHLVACGQDLDALWTSWTVRFWDKDDVIETVLTAPDRAGPLRFRDVQWDGRRLWVATSTEGIWILDRHGKVAAKIGPADGLPPGERALLLRPLADGRVFAAGSFGEDDRGWCALIEADFDGADRPARRPSVQVIHRATAVAYKSPPPAATRPWGGPLDRIILPADWCFAPFSIDAFETSEAAEPSARPSSNGPYVRVGRDRDGDDPLLFDLSPGRPPAVSLRAAPLIFDGRPQAHGSIRWGDSMMLIGTAVIARHPLVTRGADRAVTGLTAPRDAQILFRRREGDHHWGRAREDFWAFLPSSEGFYAIAGDAAFRIDPTTFACEGIGLDADLLKTGRFQSSGISQRNGLLAWGDEMCRIVIARDRPTGALEVKTVVGADGEIQVLWSGDRPTPSAEGLMKYYPPR